LHAKLITEFAMRGCFSLLLGLAAVSPGASAQAPTRVDYTLHVDSADLPSITVEMRIRGAPAEFRVAMATHAEYDDQYWRYLTNLRGESAAVAVTRADSAVWRINAAAGDVTLRYRVQFPASPPMQQASWKGHLTPMGGLIGGPHSFLYVVGGEMAPVRVTLALPSGWKVATGLEGGAGNYTAPNAEALIDSPIMVGRFRSWRFDVDGVPHDVAFLGVAGGAAFDTTLFAANVERMARQTVRLFGKMPYSRYQFLFEDGASGGLEHLNSVSIGTLSSNLARDPNSYLGQIAHEFFHTWNEVHLRPVAWIGIRHVFPQPTGELWFSEGVTLYYADLILRRAGLATADSTRIAHLERMMGSYFANPSQAAVSPEQTSRAFNLQAVLGDYTPSMFTQGELLGVALDLMIREGSHGARSLDDVMRAMSSEFSVTRGFASADVERAVGVACDCDAHSFFERYVRAAGSLDFDRWLSVVGLRSVVTWAPARAPDGTPAPDVRTSAYVVAGEHDVRVQIWFPGTVWGQAGLHAGDRLVSWNGAAIPETQQLRAALGRLRIGDTVRVTVLRDSGPFTTTVKVPGYDRPTVRIELRTDATSAQRALLVRWMAGR
jgi:predicted metalloprotease with PDZ domain